MPLVAVPFTHHHRTEAEAVAGGGTDAGGASMRTVAPKRQVRDGFGRFLELYPVGYLTGLQTENVPSRTDHRALYRRKHRINQPAFVRRPRMTIGTPWGQRQNRITPHVLVGRQWGIHDGIGLGRRVGLHLRRPPYPAVSAGWAGSSLESNWQCKRILALCFLTACFANMFLSCCFLACLPGQTACAYWASSALGVLC